MEAATSTEKKQPLYKKLIGIGIMIAVVIYCVPELQETLRSGIEFLKDEWRQWQNERQ